MHIAVVAQVYCEVNEVERKEEEEEERRKKKEEERGRRRKKEEEEERRQNKEEEEEQEEQKGGEAEEGRMTKFILFLSWLFVVCLPNTRGIERVEHLHRTSSSEF